LQADVGYYCIQVDTADVEALINRAIVLPKTESYGDMFFLLDVAFPFLLPPEMVIAERSKTISFI
jgi:hypothetical protein